MRRTLLAVALTTATAQRKLFSQLPAEFDEAFDHEPLFIPAASQPDDSAAAFWEALEDDDTGRLPVPKLFFAAYGAICAVSLGGGALLGARSFRGSVAEEALDRLNPSPIAGRGSRAPAAVGRVALEARRRVRGDD